MMSQPFKAGSKEKDLAQYADFAATATIEQRRHAARAAFLLLWGSVWSVTERVSFIVSAIDRLLAFAGDDAATDVALDWRLIDWADVDEGSSELIIAARTRMRLAFRPNQSPSGHSYWSGVITNTKRGVRLAGLDVNPAAIVPCDVIGKLELEEKTDEAG